MRNGILLVVGLFLIVSGLAAGVLLERHRAFGPPAPRGPGPEEATVKRKPKKGAPALEADRRSLLGLWLLQRKPGSAPKILVMSEDSFDIHDFGGDFGHRPTYVGIRLEDRDGQRLIVASEPWNAVLCSYHLDGDRLVLEDRPRPEYWSVDHPDKGPLTGTWLRLKASEDAEPGAAVTRCCK